MIDCPGCQEPVEGAGFDAGCNDGCSRTACTEHVYCEEACFDRANDRAATREYEDFHGGSGPASLDEQRWRAYEIKEGR